MLMYEEELRPSMNEVDLIFKHWLFLRVVLLFHPISMSKAIPLKILSYSIAFSSHI
jgi:hypothetical protein